MEVTTPNLDPATWLGRSQAFGLIAHQCTAAQAECLRAIHQTEAYKSLGLNWEQFCDQHVGMHNLDEFGATYFRLAEIVHLSPDLYRHLLPKIDGQTIEISGHEVPIVPENATRIRTAVQLLRADLQKSRDDLTRRTNPSITGIQIRLDACIDDMSRIATLATAHADASHKASMRGLCAYTLDHIQRVARIVAQ
jgi:hypothetical protein